MSDLPGGSGRAANGGARAAAGPVPVQQHAPAQIRTPVQIMRAREERNARKQAETEAREREEQQKAQLEERIKSAERRAAAAGVAGGNTRDSGYRTASEPAYTPMVGGNTSSEGFQSPYVTAGAARAAAAERQQQPKGNIGGPVSQPAPARAPEAPSGGRSRGPSLSQGQPRAAPQQSAAATARQAHQPSTHARQPSASATAAQPRTGGGATGGQSTARSSATMGDSQSRDPTVSSFPHAFERWEQLSSHWEGLTSYWIRRLEQNTEEVRREPLAQQMSRQITDLSAAGANLFHAVVELQRLRASSERKFQRWFYETRSEQERSQEVQAQISKAIEVERQARMDAEANLRNSEQARRNSEKMVVEMRRELAISKEEARRAWEELGRREQEERERTMSLREGQPTLVGGVQVVPMAAGLGNSRHGSMSQQGRPTTSGSQGQQSASGMSGAGPTPIEGGYSYDEAQSPTDTDPFTEGNTHLHHEQDVPSLAQGTYQPMPPTSGAGVTTPSTARTAIPPTSQPGQHYPQQAHQHQRSSPPPVLPSAAAEAASHFYQHEGQGSFLPGGRSDAPTSSNLSSNISGPGGPGGPDSGAPSAIDDGPSYVGSELGDESSIGGEEWMIDEHGRFVTDAAGRRIPYRAGMRGVRSPDSEDDYDVQSDIARERELAQRYGITPATSGGGVVGGVSSPVSIGSGSGVGSPTAGPYEHGGYAVGGAGGGAYSPAPDYTGSGYGEWSSMTPRHHHPTRLSDVLEEDERSRTSLSRTSQTSRGLY